MQTGIEHSVKTYIDDNFLFGDGTDLSSSESLIESGILDSTGVIEIVSFLEDEFAISISDNEIVKENMDSILSITTFVTKKRAA